MQLINKYLLPVRALRTYKYLLGCKQVSLCRNRDNNNFITSNPGFNQFRFYCEDSPPRSERNALPTLMTFPEVVWPSFIKTVKNWIFASFIIRPHMDRDFDISDFIEGSKQAVEVISAALGESDFSTLKNLVTHEAYNELHDSVSKMTVAEREQLTIIRDDIYFTFPFEVGVMFDKNDRRWVEITMCFHVLRGLKNMRNAGEDPPITLGVQPEYKNKLFILNYRFVKEFTKGVEDSWIVNVVNHFKPADKRL